MKLRLNSLKEGAQTIELTLSKGDLAITDTRFQQPILAKLNIYKGTHQITVKGKLNTNLNLECDRCLEPYKLNLEASFQSILSSIKSLSSDIDENVIPITPQTREVDLTPFARDALFIEIPMKKICSENCKGICPGCGKNLNIDTCRCENKKTDDRWKPLENLLTNIAED